MVERVININVDEPINTRETPIREQVYHGRHRRFMFTPPWEQRFSDCVAYQTISVDLPPVPDGWTPPADWDTWDDWYDADDNFIGWARDWQRQLQKK